MEINLFIFLFVFALFLFCIGFFRIFIKTDYDRSMFSVISGIFFLILMIQSLNLEYIVYDPNIPDWISYRMAEHGYEFLFLMGINFIFGAISFLNSFLLLAPIWNKNFRNKDLKGF